jgi:uncharacterized FlaG/YvyC family protein|tara:strand:- start:3100 stop:3381 length:282 start_codon:yes stop_codon:yes gene_type:complete
MTDAEVIEGQRLEINRTKEVLALKDKTIAEMTRQRDNCMAEIPKLIAQIQALSYTEDLAEMSSQLAEMKVKLDKEVSLRLQEDFYTYLKESRA